MTDENDSWFNPNEKKYPNRRDKPRRRHLDDDTDESHHESSRQYTRDGPRDGQRQYTRDGPRDGQRHTSRVSANIGTSAASPAVSAAVSVAASAAADDINDSITSLERSLSSADDELNNRFTRQLTQDTFKLKVFKQIHKSHPPTESELQKNEYPDHPNIEIKVTGYETTFDRKTRKKIRQEKSVKHNVSFYYVDNNVQTEGRTYDETQLIRHCSCVFTPNINNGVANHNKYRIIIIDRSRKEKELSLNDILYTSEPTGIRNPNFHIILMTTSQLLLLLSRSVFIYDKAKNASYPMTRDIIESMVGFFDDNIGLIQRKQIRWACILDKSLLTGNNNLINNDELVIDFLHNIIGLDDSQIYRFCS